MTNVRIFRSVSVLALSLCGVLLGVESAAGLVCVGVALAVAVAGTAGRRPTKLEIVAVFWAGALALQLTWMHGQHSLQLLAALVLRLGQQGSARDYSEDAATWSDMSW